MGASENDFLCNKKFTWIWGALLCLILQTYVQGQGCGSREPTAEELLEREKLIAFLRKGRTGARATAEPHYVPLRFHVVRRSDGSGGVNNVQINEALARLNDYYWPGGIQFYLAGSTPDFINSDEFYEYDYSEEDVLTAGKDLSDAANIYLVGSISFQSSPSTGYAYYPSVLAISNRLFLRADRLADSRTLAHELGHYFNVLHTFHNNAHPDVTLRELVTRGGGANCAVTGDLLCDTPADPQGLPATSTQGCTYTGTARDANGDLYQPALANMMSYYYACGNEFTPGQYERLGGGLLLRTNPGNEYTLDYPALTAVPAQVVATPTRDGVLVTFSDAGLDESGFIVERSTTQEGPFVPIRGLDANLTSFVDATVAANTLYYYRVRASNGTEYSSSDTAQVDLVYCKPTYYFAGSPMVIADFFLSKNGLNLIAKTNTGTTPDSYSDFTATVGEVQAGQSYEVLARAATSGSYYPQHLSIWIDLDQDGAFDPSDLVFQTTANAYMAPGVQGTISIPVQARSGLTRMRVRSQYYAYGLVTNPCGLLTYGEAEDYTLHIENSNLPAIQTDSLSSTLLCPGDSIQVYYTATGTFTGTVFTVQLAPGPGEVFFSISTQGTAGTLTASLPDTLTPGGQYRVRVVGSNPLLAGSEAPQTLFIRHRIQAILSGGGGVTAGDSATLTIARTTGGTPWQFTLSDGSTHQAGEASVYVVRVAPAATTTYTLTAVQDGVCGPGTGSGTATVTISAPGAVSLRVRVFLEGPYRATTGLMITTLNQRGLLPGQTPVSSSAIPTPPGQPYGRSPWNYTGTEAVSNYPAKVVDWVLISLRAGSPSVQNTVYKAAALLEHDGWVRLENIPDLPPITTYYIVIEHRNHLGVLSHVPVSIVDNRLIYDFTTQDSYTATVPVSVGQKQIGTVFALHSCDGNKGLPNQDFVVNVNDYNLWLGSNGKFDLYSETDFSLDAQISASDKVLWNSNNSKFSLIGRQ